jgi:hypothetical protein
LTNDGEYGFYFQESGLGGYQGPNDPAGEYFASVGIEESLAREIIQNSLDAKSDEASQVRVEFELRSLPTSGLPDINRLRATIGLAVTSSENLQGEAYLESAAVSANSESVPVLRVGDYGTKGLGGSESKDDPHSALSTLTRSTGASSNQGDRGGSFGIGSAVGPLASKMRTVAYVSRPEKDSENVFAAISKLSSFKDEQGAWHFASGFYTSLKDITDFKYERGIESLAGFEARVEPGTDVYVLDYRGAKDDPALTKIKRAAVENFLVAIHRGRLVVSGWTEKGDWILDTSSLAEVIDSDPELVASIRPFYRAITSGVEVLNREIPGVGEVELHVHVDPELKKRVGTQLMRRPLMRVQTINHTFHVPYAAVFIANSDEGNRVLREIEPPTHDRWNDKGPRSNPAVVSSIKRFIRDQLREILPQQVGDTMTIADLAKYLPKLEGSATEGVGLVPTPTPDEVSNVEGVARLGKPEKVTALDRTNRGPVIATVVQSGTASPGAELPGAGGTRGGDGNSKDDPKRTKPTLGTPGEGSARIRSAEVSFRSFANSSDGSSTIILISAAGASGDLELAGFGNGDRDVFELQISSATLERPDGERQLRTSNSTIHDLEIAAGEKVSLRVSFERSARYRLGVKDA